MLQTKAKMCSTQVITRQQLMDLFKEMNHTSIVSIITKTEPELKCPKTHVMAGRINKLSYINGMIGNWDYETSVNNRLSKENKAADFVVAPRKWGSHINGTPFILHKDNYYVEVRVLNVYNTEYLLDGNVVNKEDIQEYLPNSSKNNSGRQRTDNPVIVHTYKIDSIKKITYNKKVYQII